MISGQLPSPRSPGAEDTPLLNYEAVKGIDGNLGVAAALAALTPAQRNVFIPIAGFTDSGLPSTPVQVAGELDLDVKTVDAHLLDARRRLKRYFAMRINENLSPGNVAERLAQGRDFAGVARVVAASGESAIQEAAKMAHLDSDW